jgi:hypothetical protein
VKIFFLTTAAGQEQRQQTAKKMSAPPQQQTAAVDLGLPFPKELQPYRDGVARISQQPSAASSPTSIRQKPVSQQPQKDGGGGGAKGSSPGTVLKWSKQKKWAVGAAILGGVVILAVVIALAVTLRDKNNNGKDDLEEETDVRDKGVRDKGAKKDKKKQQEKEREKDTATVFSESLKEFLQPQNIVRSPMPAKESNPFAGAAPLSPM